MAATAVGLVACQGRRLPPPPAVNTTPPSIPDAQPAIDAPLFLGQSAFAAPLARQIDFAPVLASGRGDGGNTGATDRPAPLGRAPVTGSAAVSLGPPLLWDAAGDFTAGCTVAGSPGARTACLAAVNASTLSVQARWLPAGQDLNLATTVIDASERIIVTSRQGHLFVLTRPDSPGLSFGVVRDIDVASHLLAGRSLLAAVPDGVGNLWFTTGGPASTAPADAGDSAGETVGYVTVDNQIVTTTLVDQRVETGFAVDQSTVYLATAPAGSADHAGAAGNLYALSAAAGQVEREWQASYDAGSEVKAGGTNRGTPSPPLLLGPRFVGLVDNSDDQAHLLVFERGGAASPAETTTISAATPARSVSGPVHPTSTADPARGGPSATRLVCRIGLFTAGASAVTSAVVGYSSDAGASVVAANGLNTPRPLTSPSDGGPDNNLGGMAPGVTRVEVAADGSGCQTAWTVPLRLASGVVLSTATGLVYGYGQDPDRAAGGIYIWYFLAIDFRSGRVVWQQRAGAGSTKNPNRQPLVLGANGVLYQTLPLGLAWMRDLNQPA